MTMTPETDLLTLERWLDLMGRLGITRDRKTFRTLLTHYNDPQRHYHNAAHVADCLRQLALSGGAADRPDELELAIYFHDAIYETRSPDNEARSAAWAQRFMRSHAMGAAAALRVAALIMVTRHEGLPANYDEQLLVDIDLSIFGRPPAAFDRYQSQIRQEYEWVPDPVYRRRRAEILEAFQERPRLYHTDWFYETYETQARDNLARAIADLRSA